MTDLESILANASDTGAPLPTAKDVALPNAIMLVQKALATGTAFTIPIDGGGRGSLKSLLRAACKVNAENPLSIKFSDIKDGDVVTAVRFQVSKGRKRAA